MPTERSGAACGATERQSGFRQLTHNQPTSSLDLPSRTLAAHTPEGSMECPRCQHENPQGARFCEECATPLARTCSSCGIILSATAKFCHACAHPIAVGAGTPARSLDSYTPKHLA